MTSIPPEDGTIAFSPEMQANFAALSYAVQLAHRDPAAAVAVLNIDRHLAVHLSAMSPQDILQAVMKFGRQPLFALRPDLQDLMHLPPEGLRMAAVVADRFRTQPLPRIPAPAAASA